MAEIYHKKNRQLNMKFNNIKHCVLLLIGNELNRIFVHAVELIYRQKQIEIGKSSNYWNEFARVKSMSLQE